MKFYLCIFWLCCAACRLLVPIPGTEAEPLAVKVQSPNHWTTREFPSIFILKTLQITNEEKIKYLLINLYISGAEITIIIIIINNIIITNEETEV